MRETKRIYLREFELEDAKILFRKFNNPEIISKMDLDINTKEFTLEEERNWIEKTREEYVQENRENYNLAIMAELDIENSYRRKKMKELVGGIGAHKIDYKERVAEICYWIDKNHQGRGYATAAIKIFCDRYLFGKFRKVRAEVFDNNIASQRVLENVGFHCIEKKLNEKTDSYDFFYEMNNPLMNKKYLFRKIGVWV